MTKRVIGDMVGHPADPRQYQDHPELPADTQFGVEVELEDCTLTAEWFANILHPHWIVSKDNSLRGNDAYEFKFAFPLAGQDAVTALQKLEVAFVGAKLKPSCSVRTSVHVHIDIRDMEPAQFQKYIATAFTVDKLLYNYCEPHRRNNIFCLPLSEAEADLRYWGNMYAGVIEGNSRVAGSSTRLSRYTGINGNSISHYGSVEFRMHHGEWKFQPLLQWLQILRCIKVYALNNHVPISDWPTAASSTGISNVVHNIFGVHTNKLIYPGYEHDVLEGIRIAQDIIFNMNGNLVNKVFTELENSVGRDSPFSRYEARFLADNPTSEIFKASEGRTWRATASSIREVTPSKVVKKEKSSESWPPGMHTLPPDWLQPENQTNSTSAFLHGTDVHIPNFAWDGTPIVDEVVLSEDPQPTDDEEETSPEGDF